MNNKFFRKQLATQALTLLFFIITFNLIFIGIYFYHAQRIAQSQLENKALSIAETIGKYSLSSSQISSLYTKDNLRLIAPNDDYDIWIVEVNNLDIISNKQKIAYYQLPPEDIADIKDVFAGNTFTSQHFGNFTFNEATTVGVPIYDKDHQVRAALLLHEKKQPLLTAFFDIIPIITAISLVLYLLSLGLLYLLMKKRIHDINVVNRFTERLVSGQYNIRTKVKSTDEIGKIYANLNTLAEYVQQ